jgi:hypothetical protein
MSGLPPGADIARPPRHVRNVPKLFSFARMAVEDRGPLMPAHVGMMLARRAPSRSQRRAPQKSIEEGASWQAIGDVRL